MVVLALSVVFVILLGVGVLTAALCRVSAYYDALDGDDAE